MEFGARLKLIREAEGLSQDAFARELEMTVSGYRQIEVGRRSDPRLSTIEKITGHPRFGKYTLWLLTETAAPAAGQVSPEIEHQRAG